MALDEYRSKRDFTRSPEPAGDADVRARTGSGPLFFCVQKHLASHLHYDFRLEHDGVLLSWAVPKGPAIDPTVKRLAMQVEDHPIEYGTFEGVIPDGYGAGIVMLWDRGTWEPDVPDVSAALRKGDLKFRLDGVKLKGSWALVRTRGAGERSWLLLKHRDVWSGPLDIAEFAPLSVESGGDFADILAEENPAIWISHRPARTGDAGAMFGKIVARAMELRRARDAGDRAPAADRTTTHRTGGSNKADAKTRKATNTTKGTTATKPTTAVAARMTRSAGPAKPHTTAASTGSTASRAKRAASQSKLRSR